MFSFAETTYAKRLFDSQIPKLIKELSRIANALEKQNEILNKENNTKQ